jgi:hypothetical protein
MSQVAPIFALFACTLTASCHSRDDVVGEMDTVQSEWRTWVGQIDY